MTSNFSLTDGIDITINGWFMDRTHFRGLSNDNFAVLNVPTHKLVRLFVGVAYLGLHKCFFHHNRHSLQPNRKITTANRYSRYIFDIKAGKDEGDGQYIFKCSTVFVSILEGEEQTIETTKNIVIRSTQGTTNQFSIAHTLTLIISIIINFFNDKKDF